MPADNPTCSTCRWWQEFYEPDPTEEQEGYCRRNAPRPAFEAQVPSDEGGGRCGYPQWPRLAHYEWCGEHAPRVEAPAGSAPNAGPSAEYANFTAKVAELLGATDKARMDVDVDRAAIAVREAWPKGDA